LTYPPQSIETVFYFEMVKSYTWKDLRDPDTVLEGEIGFLWIYDTTRGGTKYKCFTENLSSARKIRQLQGVSPGAEYHNSQTNSIHYDFIIPRKKVQQVCKILKIPLTKDYKKACISYKNMIEGKFLVGNIPYQKKVR